MTLKLRREREFHMTKFVACLTAFLYLHFIPSLVFESWGCAGIVAKLVHVHFVRDVIAPCAPRTYQIVKAQARRQYTVSWISQFLDWTELKEAGKPGSTAPI